MENPELLVCEPCWQSIEQPKDRRCPRCFESLEENQVCPCEYHWPYSFSRIRSGWLFCEPLQNILHKLKYSGKSRLGFLLGERMARSIVDREYFSNIDLIVPIPLHHVRRRERGYNQSFYIAQGISSVINVPVAEKTVKRRKNTKSQTALTREERAKNISNIFLVSEKRREIISGKKLLLVDDVYTTGATVNECARVLKDAGAEEVKVLTAAKA